MLNTEKIRNFIAIALVGFIFTTQSNAQNNDQLLKNIPGDALLCV